MRRLYFLFILCVACSGKQNSPSQYTKLVYKFHDSSVPPEYHRSFTITVTPNTIEKMVDSYGDTISYEKKEIKREKFSALKKIVTEAEIANCEPSGRDNCTGGTAISIYLYNGSQRVFKGYAAQCGGENTGDMCGDPEKILNFLDSLLAKTI